MLASEAMQPQTAAFNGTDKIWLVRVRSAKVFLFLAWGAGGTEENQGEVTKNR